MAGFGVVLHSFSYFVSSVKFACLSDREGEKFRDVFAMNDVMSALLWIKYKTRYNGLICILVGSAPERIIAAAGTYTVSAVSCEFSSPRISFW